MVRSDFPTVQLVVNPTNLGFGAANNRGSDLAAGDLVLFLNSDAYAEPGAIRGVANVFADREVAGAGGMLLNADGSLQQSTSNHLTLWPVFCEQTYLEKAFPNSTALSPYWTTTRLAQTESPGQTPQIMGACLMVRAPGGKPIERFDERYFLYCEDTDLCKRLERHGKLLYVPTAKFIHDLGSSSSKNPALGVIRYNRGKELYFKIHHTWFHSAVCWLLDRVGAALRLFAWTLKYFVSLFRSQNVKGHVAMFFRVLIAHRGSDPIGERTRKNLSDADQLKGQS